MLDDEKLNQLADDLITITKRAALRMQVIALEKRIAQVEKNLGGVEDSSSEKLKWPSVSNRKEK